MSANVPKTFLFSVHNYKIYAVDGEYIRDNVEIDFTMGSHNSGDIFVPKGEIWVDKRLSEKDMYSLIIHEITETLIMQQGMEYEPAHEVSNVVERLFRTIYKELGK